MSLLFRECNLMLKKEICKKCWNKTDILKSGIRVRVFKGWHEHDENRWEKRGYLYCPMIYLGKWDKTFRDITDSPPSKCPFILEQILSKED